MALEEVVRRVTGGRKEFVNIALIDDKQTGTFRGMAFVNFHSTGDATAALAELSKMVINKRKVIAEYRRLRPGEREKKEQYEKRAKKFDHFSNNRQTFEKDVTTGTDENGNAVDKRAAFFAKRDTIRKVDEQKRVDEKAERDKEREAEFRKVLVDYGNEEVVEGADIEDIIFESTLTSYERRMVHTICNDLELGHISRFDNEGNRVLHVTRDPERLAEWEKETAEQKAAAAATKKAEAQKRKNKENGEARPAPEWKKGETTVGGAITRQELQGIKWFKPRAAKGAASDRNADAAGDAGIRAPSYKLYVPPRQPCGPDGTIGFASRSRECAADGDEEHTGLENGEEGDQSSPIETDGDAGEESGDGDVQEKQADETVEPGDGKGSTHTVLNPSVPAFSPSFTQSY